jgi:hypothetical protein
MSWMETPVTARYCGTTVEKETGPMVASKRHRQPSEEKTRRVQVGKQYEKTVGKRIYLGRMDKCMRR